MNPYKQNKLWIYLTNTTDDQISRYNVMMSISQEGMKEMYNQWRDSTV